MAVIRQTQQAFTQPIGVVRASDSGSQVWQSVNRAASTLMDIGYAEESAKAEKIGSEAAMALSASEVVDIDPATGKPALYPAPQQYGSIAAQSYQNVIDRRFESSVIRELNEVGAEIAKTSSSSAEFKQRMSSHLEAMTEIEGEDATQYTRIVSEIGSDYIAGQYDAMVKAERAAAIERGKREAAITTYEIMRRANGLSVSGGYNPSLFEKDIDYINSAVVSGQIAPSVANSAMNSIYESFGSGQLERLGRLYAGSSPDVRDKLSKAIMSPSYIPLAADELGVFPDELEMIIGSTLVSKSPNSVLEFLEGAGEIQESINATMADEYFASNSALINQNTDPRLMQALRMSAPNDEARAQMDEKWVTSKVERLMDGDIFASEYIDKLNIMSVMFSESTFNEDGFRRLLGDDDSAIAVAGAVSRMSLEDRTAIGEKIDQRRIAMERVIDPALAQAKTNFTLQIMESESIRELMEFTELLRNDAEFSRDGGFVASSITKIDERASVLGRAALARMVRNEVPLEPLRDFLLSAGDEVYTDMSDLINGGLSEDQAFKRWREFLERGYVGEDAETLLYMRETNPSLFNSAFADYINVQNRHIEARVNSGRTAAAYNAMLQGEAVSTEDMNLVDSQIFGGNVVTTANLMGFQGVPELLAKGSMTPKIAEAFERGIQANGEALDQAVDMFEMFSRGQSVDAMGNAVSVDLMRQNIKTETYAMYQGLSSVRARTGLTAANLILRLNEVTDGKGFAEIDRTILKDADADTFRAAILSVAENQFNGRSVAPEILADIFAEARWSKVMGETIDESWMANAMNRYVEDMRMKEDPTIVGYNIGDKTMYSLGQNGVGPAQVSREAIQLLKAIDEQDEDMVYTNITVGGTRFDTWVRTVKNAFSPDVAADRYIDNLFAKMRFMLGGSYNPEGPQASAQLDAALAGLPNLGVDIKYRPVVSEFAVGNPTWEVGFVQDFGGITQFSPIELNGEIVTIQKEVGFASDPKIAKYKSRYEQVSRQRDSNQINVALAEYLSSLAHIKTVKDLELALGASTRKISTANGLVPVLSGRVSSIRDSIELKNNESLEDLFRRIKSEEIEGQ